MKIETEFTGLPLRKLESLMSDDWDVSGVHIQRMQEDGTLKHGAVTTGGMVLWWHPEQERVIAPSVCSAMQQALEALEPLSAYGRVGSRDVEQAAAQAAISALREALAAANSPESGGVAPDWKLPPLPEPGKKQGQQMSYDGDDKVFFDCYDNAQMAQYAKDAINLNINEALAAPNSVEFDGIKTVAQQSTLVKCTYGDGGRACCEGGPCRAEEQNNAALAEPVVEPVATFDEVFDAIDWDVWRMQPIRELVRMIHSKTSPQLEVPQANPQPLTDEHIDTAIRKEMGAWLEDEEDLILYRQLARAVEAAHGIQKGSA